MNKITTSHIIIDIEDIDNPRLLRFMASPEWAVYLILRRGIWRSEKKHVAGLEGLWRAGKLSAVLEPSYAAACMGISNGVDDSSVTACIGRLRDDWKVIERDTMSVMSAQENVYTLGVVLDRESGIEKYYLDRVLTKPEKPVKEKSDHAKVVEYFTVEYEKKFARKYPFNGPVDAPLIKKILNQYDIALVKKAIDAYFESAEPFVVTAGYSVRIFKVKIDQLVQKIDGEKVDPTGGWK